MQTSAVAHSTPRGFLKVTQPLFCSAQHLTLQTTQHQFSVSQHVACLFLNLANETPDVAVDVVCVHAVLSLELR
jgi:hypothetical protein